MWSTKSIDFETIKNDSQKVKKRQIYGYLSYIFRLL